MLNRCVFSCHLNGFSISLNIVIESAWCTSGGKLFHASTPAIAKLRFPNLVHVQGTSRRLADADRRLLRNVTEMP